MKMNGWVRMIVAITVAWSLIVLGAVGYDYERVNPFCAFGNNGPECQHVFWTWLYVAPSHYELEFVYARFAVALLLPLAVLWFCFGAAVWIRAGFKASK